LFAGLIVATAAPPDLVAQDVEELGRKHGVRPPPGYYEVLAADPTAYQFNEVWREIARQVSEQRRALARAGDWAGLNAHLADGPSRAAATAAGIAVTGTFRFPVITGMFSDSTHALLPDTAGLNAKLFTTGAAPPYSITKYYDEVSNTLLTVTGDVVGWFTVDSAAAWYAGTNNGLNPGTDRLGDYIQELLNQADPLIDFSQYDNDNNGTVDLIAILHPLVGGECGTSNIWAHRWVYRVWKGAPYTTADGVTVDDYVVQAAVGGTGGCTASDTMEIGTMTHELGHGILNIPDLYDTGGNSEGIGEWGLMGSGNWNVQNSPAHLGAWSKDEVGWIAIDTVDASQGTGSQTLSSVVPNDTAMRVDISGTNEYFLLENRQGNGSETGNLNGPGLLIWHIDPDRIAARRNANQVNAIVPHGVDLEQADGSDHLGNNVNRGDTGDPWPGSSNNTVFGPSTTPNSELNDNSNSALRVDSITQNGDGSVGFRVNFNVVNERVTTSIGVGTEVIVDGSNENAPHDVVWAFPSNHSISVDSIQGDTLMRYVFQSWSDGGARSHNVAADATPDTFIANLDTEHRLKATTDIQGNITSSETLDASGVAWVAPTQNVSLKATPATSGFFFVEWTGDVSSTNDSIEVNMAQPQQVHAEFGTAVAISTTALTAGVIGAAYVDTLMATGGSGNFTWTQVGGDALPAGLNMNAQGVITGAPEEDGSFAMVFQAVSGALSSTQDTVTMSVTTPTLALSNVVNHLLGPIPVLSDDEENYLDIIGNNNGRFDVGDFRAYLQDTGVVTDVVPATTKDQPAHKEEGR
jgi:M6 family metalloprotease-like protein